MAGAARADDRVPPVGSGRARPGRAADRTHALSVVDELGAGALTMKTVASRLGVTEMALYHHVADKSALVALLVEASMEEEPLPAPTGDGWVEDLVSFARWMRSGVVRHPQVVHIRRTFNVWSPGAYRAGDRWVSLWQQSGLVLADAITAAELSSSAIMGVLEEEVVRQARQPDPDALRWLPSLKAAFDRPRRRTPTSGSSSSSAR